MTKRKYASQQRENDVATAGGYLKAGNATEATGFTPPETIAPEGLQPDGVTPDRIANRSGSSGF